MPTKDEAHDKISALVRNYITNKAKFIDQLELDTRTKFIDRMLEALGWDVYGSVIPDEVEREQPVKTKDVGKKKADYILKINGITKLTIEAKSLGEDLTKDEYIAQAIMYAYNRDCSWAVLTNFVRTRIIYVDRKGGNQFYKIDFSDETDFEDNFNILWYLSKESVLSNALESEAKRRGISIEKIHIDQQLLDDLKTWRQLVSSDIKNRYPNKYAPHTNDEIVQRIIDRLIFIRMAEDSQLEDPVLEPIARRPNENTYDEVKKVFVYFRKRYDSKLFEDDNKSLHEADKIDLSNDTIEKVIRGMLRPSNGKVKYNFASMDADILGAIYERYLAYVLSQTPKRVKLEGGIAHRKEQGIYYTPTYIVDYIVRHTLGELLKNQRPEGISKIRVLDPACGSGSFLIKAYDIIDAYLRRSVDYQTNLDIEADLPFSRKVEILRNNIFGVDLDSKAVEITQLNLLMKIAESGERLPVLQRNIKCGNSVIEDPSAMDHNPLDWKQAFPEIMNGGGFDVLIGNPPYVRQEDLREIKSFLEGFEVHDSIADLFVYFFERELKLLKDDGYFGMIVSNKWLKAGYGARLRHFLKQFSIEQFIDFGDLKVFQDATTYPCIIIIRKRKPVRHKMKVCLVRTLEFDSLETYVQKNNFLVDQQSLQDEGWNLKEPSEFELFEKISRNHIPLKEFIDGNVFRGIVTGLTKAFIIDELRRKELISQDPKSDEIIKPILRGSEVGRYVTKSKNNYIILTKNGVDMKRYPAILNWLTQFKDELEARWDQGNHWYELRSCEYYDLFSKPKIIYGKITTRPRFTLDYDGYFLNDANFFIPVVDKGLVAILNSRLGWFLVKNTCTELQGGYQLIWEYFGNIPISKIRSPNLEQMVDEIISLNKELLDNAGQNTDATRSLKERIRELQITIDLEVYKSYDLTPEEIKLIQTSTSSLQD